MISNGIAPRVFPRTSCWPTYCDVPVYGPFFFLKFLGSIAKLALSRYFNVNGPKDPWPRVLSLPGARVVCWRPQPAGTRQYLFWRVYECMYLHNHEFLAQAIFRLYVFPVPIRRKLVSEITSLHNLHMFLTRETSLEFGSEPGKGIILYWSLKPDSILDRTVVLVGKGICWIFNGHFPPKSDTSYLRERAW